LAAADIVLFSTGLCQLSMLSWRVRSFWQRTVRRCTSTRWRHVSTRRLNVLNIT